MYQCHVFTSRLGGVSGLYHSQPITAKQGIETLTIIKYVTLTLCQQKTELLCELTHSFRGTGMVASSSTFYPHLGREVRDLVRLLHAVLHGTEAQSTAIIQGKLQPPRHWP